MMKHRALQRWDKKRKRFVNTDVSRLCCRFCCVVERSELNLMTAFLSLSRTAVVERFAE
jgi:hypothetical protein